MADRAAKRALFDEFARVGKALGSGRRIELLDVRPEAEHTAGHVPGAVSIPLAELRRRLTGAAARPRDRRLLPRPVVRLRPRGGRAAAPGGMAGAAAGGRAAGVGGGRPAGRA